MEGAELSEVLYVGVGGDECSKLPRRHTHLFFFFESEREKDTKWGEG